MIEWLVTVVLGLVILCAFAGALVLFFNWRYRQK